MSKLRPIVVLCVDDEPTGLMARRLILSIAGYDVLTAINGDYALRIFGRQTVDVVITDYFLPDVSGTELAREMKRLRPEVPVVLLTGSLDPPPGSEKADLVLTKGMDPPDFLAAIARLVPRRESPANKMH